MVVVQARVHTIASGREAVARAIRDLIRETREQEGCIDYVAAELLGEPGEFLIASTWEDEQAMRAHYEGTSYGRYAPAVTPFLARPTETVVYGVAEPLQPVGDPSAEPLRQD
jgi:quinol monooxygenase YgiN